ncbi:MAG: nodulation protein NfeD [Sphingomonadales bacterium]
MLRHRLIPAIAALVLGLAGLAVAADGQGRRIVVLPVQGAIGPAIAEFVETGLEDAAAEGAALVVIRMDTPGGLDTAMRDIIRAILASPVPVATFVSPSGARAASAGTYILYASHVAAMAPGTNLGAATPVGLGGSPTKLPSPAESDGDKDDANEGGGKKDDKSGPSGDAQSSKAINDSAAYIQSLAEMRGRNAEWAVKAVREAASLPAAEALRLRVIDLMADDIDALVAALDGRTVTMGDGVRTLRIAGLPVEAVAPGWRIKLLSVITNPNVALLLMMIGFYGLLLEFYSPGTYVPGTLGAISLLLGLYALNVLPVTLAGVAMVVLGLLLMTAEALAPSFGVLGIGGAIAFVVGATLLMETEAPGFTVSLPLVIGMTAVLGGGLAVVLTLAVRAHRRPVAAGEEGAAGHRVTVIDWDGAGGTVDYRGERWRAVGPEGLSVGDAAYIRRRDGLTLTIATQPKEGA